MWKSKSWFSNLQLCIRNLHIKISRASVYRKREYMEVTIFDSVLFWIQKLNRIRPTSRSLKVLREGELDFTLETVCLVRFLSCIMFKCLCFLWVFFFRLDGYSSTLKQKINHHHYYLHSNIGDICHIFGCIFDAIRL